MPRRANRSQRAPDKADKGFAGFRVLVVEDNALIAMALEDILIDLGCEVVGPASSVEEAMGLIGKPIDGALLDVSVRGALIYPVADALIEQGVPVVLCSGYAMTSAIPETYAAVPQIAKPYNSAMVRDGLAACLNPDRRRHTLL